MDTSESTVALCDQCGGVLPVGLGTAVTDCAFCGVTNHVDRARTVFHYAVRQTVRDADALAALRRWMAGNLTVKNLDRKAAIEKPRYTLFPFWMVHTRRQAQEQVWLKPAAGIAVSEVSDLTIPAAALEPFADVNGEDAQPATVPVTALERWLAADHAIPADAIEAIALVHLPLFICHYRYDGRRYTAVVDAASSRVCANVYPPKPEWPYKTLAGIAFVLYLIIACIPTASFIAGDFGGGLVTYALAAAVISVLVFVAALIIAARV